MKARIKPEVEIVFQGKFCGTPRFKCPYEGWKHCYLLCGDKNNRIYFTNTSRVPRPRHLRHRRCVHYYP